MKTTIKVISYKNLPARAPILLTAVAYLYLDRYNAPGWVWGIVGTLMAFLWISYMLANYWQEQIDLRKEKITD